jgi:hypothetical protein
VQLPPDIDTQSAVAEIYKEITVMRSDISSRTGHKSDATVTDSMVHGLDFGCSPSRANSTVSLQTMLTQALSLDAQAISSASS